MDVERVKVEGLAALFFHPFFVYKTSELFRLDGGLLFRSRRLLCGVVTRFLSIRFRHELAMLGLTVELAVLMIDF